ncbi:hypothetical protein EDD18DRAFT_1356638 [Armillaria luteobubalina]|uniref:F-box domain-containing protein n=1 Tax=Armillaria luteobubalina TaxID=153913 RepID=A0AA39Q1J1_9AGAR|nr:hypothetical protein EDD18DRAFT_1356638 [Armillaria luteobubalina]
MPQHTSITTDLRYSPSRRERPVSHSNILLTRPIKRCASQSLTIRQRHWTPLQLPPSRLLTLPIELQLEICSYMSNCDLLQSTSACRQVLEIVVKILAKRLELWDEQGSCRVTSESFSAVKLWLCSQQGRQTPSGIKLSLNFFDLEGLRCCIQFLTLAAPHQFVTIGLNLDLSLSHPMTVEWPLLECFFSLVHDCAPQKVYLFSMMSLPPPPHSGLQDCPPFTFPSLSSTKYLTIFDDKNSFLSKFTPSMFPDLEELVLARSSRLPEQWNCLANVCLKNLTKLRLSTTIPAHIVRALLQHHLTLIMLDTVSATIVNNVPDLQAMHDYEGFNCGLTFLSGRPTLLVPILTGATFKGLGWLKLEPECGPSSVEAFFQFILPTIFSSSNLTRKTHVELSLPCPPKEGLNKFQFFHLITQPHIPLQVDYLRLTFNGYDNVDDILKVWLLCETFITGINIILWVTRLQGAAIDKIILFMNTSNTFHWLSMQGKDNHMCRVTNVAGRAHSVKLVPGTKPSSSS